MRSEKISVIIPVYKVEKELNRCVQSVVHQTYSNLEIILVDDGSPDNCPELCDEYAKQDDRIVVIHKKNGGLSDARNAGLRKATGEFILYVDSDDYLELDGCERLCSAMQDGVDVVVGACKEMKESSISFQKHSNLECDKVYTAREYVIASIRANEWYAPAWLNLYRKQFLIDHNLFYKVGFYFEDMEMLPRLFLANPNVVYVDYAFYNYIIRENSIMTSQTTNEKIQMRLEIYRGWLNLIHGIEDPEYQRYLYGILTRYYLTTARQCGFQGWKVEEIDFSFAWKYALDVKEKLKVLLYNFFPKQFIKIKR